jgi:hypothetical protein
MAVLQIARKTVIVSDLFFGILYIELMKTFDWTSSPRTASGRLVSNLDGSDDECVIPSSHGHKASNRKFLLLLGVLALSLCCACWQSLAQEKRFQELVGAGNVGPVTQIAPLQAFDPTPERPQQRRIPQPAFCT